jgi:hypothetical protein
MDLPEEVTIEEENSQVRNMLRIIMRRLQSGSVWLPLSGGQIINATQWWK